MEETLPTAAVHVLDHYASDPSTDARTWSTIDRSVRICTRSSADSDVTGHLTVYVEAHMPSAFQLRARAPQILDDLVTGLGPQPQLHIYQAVALSASARMRVNTFKHVAAFRTRAQGYEHPEMLTDNPVQPRALSSRIPAAVDGGAATRRTV